MVLASEFGVADRCRLVDAAYKNLILYGFFEPKNFLTTMKIFPRALLILFSVVAMISFAGCGGEQKASSMTENVELSEIEAYEKAVLEMESEDMGEMDESDKP